MKWLIIGGLVLLAIWFWKRRDRAKAFAFIDEAKPWFDMVGLDFDRAMFNSHPGAPVRFQGAIPMVGIAPAQDGSLQGFVIEVRSGEGVVSGEFISRRAATQDRKLAMSLRANASKMSLMDALIQLG